jgi:hypothetical protein
MTAPVSRYFNDEELAFLESSSHLMRKEILPLFIEKFGRRDMTLSRIKHACKSQGFRSIVRGKPRATPLGAEVTTKQGVIVKVRETSKGGWPYAFKHRLFWERVNGPIPNTRILKCVDGDRFNPDPSNWVIVPKGALSRLRKREYTTAPPELKQSILAVTLLEHRIHSQGADGKLTEAQRAFLSILAQRNTTFTRKDLPPVDRRESKVREFCRSKGYAIFSPRKSDGVNGWRITGAGRAALVSHPVRP